MMDIAVALEAALDSTRHARALVLKTTKKERLPSLLEHYCPYN